MKMRIPLVFCAALGCLLLAVASTSLWGETVRVATFNLQNYLVMDRIVEERWRPEYPKPEVSKSALREVIAAVDPDVLALQEIGPEPFLVELQRDLKAKGVDYPHAFLLNAADEERHVAVMSRLPFVQVRPHTEPDFPYFGGREKIRRGMLEVVFRTGGKTWSLFVVHLKSKWTERSDDPEADRKRTGEATAARDAILEEHDPDAGALYLIAGDLNDTRDTAPLRRFLHRGDVTISKPIPARDSQGLTWTYHWQRQGIYSQVDYLLASPALFENVVDGRGSIYDGDHYRLASDHRLVWADLSFRPEKANGTADSGETGRRLVELLHCFRES